MQNATGGDDCRMTALPICMRRLTAGSRYATAEKPMTY